MFHENEIDFNGLYCLSGFVQISDFFGLLSIQTVWPPIFQGGDLCVIMDKGPHKTHCLSGFVQILLLIHSNSLAPVFQGTDL